MTVLGEHESRITMVHMVQVPVNGQLSVPAPVPAIMGNDLGIGQILEMGEPWYCSALRDSRRRWMTVLGKHESRITMVHIVQVPVTG